MIDPASESFMVAAMLEKEKLSAHGTIGPDGRVVWDKEHARPIGHVTANGHTLPIVSATLEVAPITTNSTRPPPLDYIQNMHNQTITMQGTLITEGITAMMDEIARAYANELLFIFDPKKVRAYQRLQAKLRKQERKRKVRKRQRSARQRRHNRGLA